MRGVAIDLLEPAALELRRTPTATDDAASELRIRTPGRLPGGGLL